MQKTLSKSMNDYTAVEHRFWYFAAFILASLGLVFIGFFGLGGGAVVHEQSPLASTTIEATLSN